jgi:hypothetical protein
MLEILRTIRDTPLPLVLVIGGMVFLLIPFIRQIQTGQAVVQTAYPITAGIIGAVLLTIGIGLFLIPSGTPASTPPTAIPPTSFDQPSAIPPTNTSQTINTPVINPTVPNTSVSVEGLTDCSPFGNGETRQVPAGTFVNGDIVINGIKQYDEGGTGESTVAYFEGEAEVFAEWGAGCLMGSKTQANQVIRQQFNEEYTRVRFVVVQSDGQQVVQYYNSEKEISSASTCPSAPGHLAAGKGFSVTLQKGCHYHFNVACSGCAANVENNYIILYTGESGDVISVTVPEGSVWQYDRVPTTGEVCEAQDFYPTELPSFLSFGGVQLLRICG